MASPLTLQVKFYMRPETDADLARLKKLTRKSKSATLDDLAQKYLPAILARAEKAALKEAEKAAKAATKKKSK